MNETPAWLPFAIIGGFGIIFPMFWMGIVLFIGKMGGWSSIAAAFPADPKAPEPPGWFSWSSGRVGWMNYRSTMCVGPSEQGLHLTTVALFKVGHPPLLIPWDQMEVKAPENWFFTTVTKVSFPEKELSTIELSGAAGEAVYESWKKSRGEDA